MPDPASRTALAAALILVILGGKAVAEAPALKHFFPAGVRRGTTTQIQCEGKFDWPVRVWASGGEVEAIEDAGKLSVTIPRDLATDRIWIRLFNDDGASPMHPLLVGELPELSEVEPNDATANAQSVADYARSDGGVSVTVNGVLQKSGDVDAFAVELTEGQTLVAAVAANTKFGSPMDAILQIAAPDGEVLGENHDDVGLDPRVAFTADRDGPHIVRLFAFPSNPNSSIRFHGGKDYIYRLTLTTGPYISHTLPMSLPLEGSFSTEAQGWNLPPATRVPVTRLEDALADGAIEIEPSGVVRTAETRIGFARGQGIAGSVRLRLVPDDVVFGIAETSHQRPVTIQVPGFVGGRIRPDSSDYFRLNLNKNQQIAIAVESMSFHSPLVPLVALTDSNGKVVSETGVRGPAKDAVLTFKAAEDGPYMLTIRDRFGHGGDRYAYRLSVTEQKPDFSLSLTADAYTVTADKPLEIPITIARHAGVGQAIKAISIQVVDLPTGTTSAAVVSQPSGDTAKKVTLQVETDGTPWSGHVSVRGTAVENDTMRLGRTPAKFNACFDRIWLTVKGR